LHWHDPSTSLNQPKSEQTNPQGDATMNAWIESIDDQAGHPSTLLQLKVVPGASRDEIAGLLGDRLKVRTAAPPEGGKANKAIRQLIARTLGVKRSDVEIIAGATSPEKTVRIAGIDSHVAAARLVRN